MERFWAPHKEHVWLPCYKLRTEDTASIFESNDGSVTEIIVPAKETANLARVHESQLAGIADICKLDEVNEAAVLHTTRTRYMKSKIYTYVSRVLIAVNPFQALPIYTAEHIDRYVKNVSGEEEPHVYAIGANAVNGMRESAKNQAILISGESGAGKTETTKLLLSFLADALSGSGDINERIMQINPVLEAFGNAMTVRNNNSSRFGKWIEVSASRSLFVNSCSVTDYLLEVTRVCSQGEKERNYHIFFQLIGARDKPEMSELKILEPDKYEYLAGSTFVAPGIDDQACFDEVKEALTMLGFTSELQMEIFKVVAAILELGNVNFEDKGESCSIKDDVPLKKVTELTGIDIEGLREAVTVKKLVVGKEVTKAPLTASAAHVARDGLSRLLYGRLFSWLVRKINGTLSSAQGSKDDMFFGVLDIAGFESFQTNSLEQLFINLSNEHLQQHFNNHIFKSELDDYSKEGVSAGVDLKYRDNSDILHLIDAKGGILMTLDEQISVPKATDETFINVVVKLNENHPRFVPAKFAGARTFGIKHFAGEVTYTVKGFLEKNMDKPPDDAPSLLKASKLKVLQELGERIAEEAAEAHGSRRGSMQTKKTVSSKFRASLAALFQKLNEADPHFIRCIKPNAEKLPNSFTSTLAIEQLLNSGIMEAVAIRQQGFASRLPFDDFVRRYKVVLSKSKRAAIIGPSGPSDAKERATAFTEALVEQLHMGESSTKLFLIGNSKVFSKVTLVAALDKSRDMALTHYAVELQRFCRGFQARKKIKQLKEVGRKVKEWHVRNAFYAQKGSEYTALAKWGDAATIDQETASLTQIIEDAKKSAISPVPYEAQVKKIQHRMDQESALLRELKATLKSTDAIEISKGLARAQDLEFPKTSDIQEMEKRVEDLKVQLPLQKAMQEAIAAEDVDRLQSCMEMLKKEGLHTHPENWIAELHAMELAGRVYDEMTRLKAKKRIEGEDAARKAEQEHQVEADRKNRQTAAFAVDVAAIEKEKEKEKAEKHKARLAMMNISKKDEEEILTQLKDASDVLDVNMLEERLKHAVNVGLAEDDLQPHQELLAKLQNEEFLRTMIREEKDKIKATQPTPPEEAEGKDHVEESIEAEASSDDLPRRKRSSLAEVKEGPNTMTLRRLQNLITQAEKIGAASEVLDDARPLMQKGLKRRAKSTLRGSVFDLLDLSNIQMVDEAFSKLSDFPRMKPQSQWKGHIMANKFRGGVLGLSAGSDSMLQYSKLEIKEPLTILPRPQILPATQNFRNLLVWMGDRPASEVQRRGHSQVILECAQKEQALADEVYVQVMKQLTDNPSKRSCSLGWALMLLLCQGVAPSDTLEEFVRSFLLQRIHGDDSKDDAEDKAVAKQCIADLNMTTKQSRGNFEELVADITPVEVMLIDWSTRKVRIASSATLTDLGRQVAEQLHVQKPDEFSFFQMIQGVDAHRLLPDTIVLNSLLPKWKKLATTTGKVSKLLWKRRFMRVDETLQTTDLMHAKLTYHQALWDYLHYPIHEDLPYICNIAGMILMSDKDHFAKYIQEKKLGDPSILEQLLPDYTMRFENNRQTLANQVMRAYQKLQNTCDTSEGRFQRMSHVISLLQRLRLFGTYFWMCKQTYNVPADKMSLPEAPSQSCKINPKDPEAEYWICVDLFGVRFLSLDSTPGAEYMRGFLLRDESVERVLRWSAKQDVLTLIVQTYQSPTNTLKDGRKTVNPTRLPMTIQVTSPAAVDIAHTLQCAARERR